MTESPSAPEPRRLVRRPKDASGAEARDDTRNETVLPDVSRDDTDLGWGDEPSSRDDDWYRRERPPHHE